MAVLPSQSTEFLWRFLGCYDAHIGRACGRAQVLKDTKFFLSLSQTRYLPSSFRVQFPLLILRCFFFTPNWYRTVFRSYRFGFLLVYRLSSSLTSFMLFVSVSMRKPGLCHRRLQQSYSESFLNYVTVPNVVLLEKLIVPYQVKKLSGCYAIIIVTVFRRATELT
jgi:hypothetical protein